MSHTIVNRVETVVNHVFDEERIVNKYYETALHHASFNGDVEEVERLIKEGYNLNARTEHFEVPLHYAAIKGHAKVIAKLVEAGAELDLYNNDGVTPLMLSLLNHNAAASTILIEKGSNYNLYSHNGIQASMMNFDMVKKINKQLKIKTSSNGFYRFLHKYFS